jgi:outer membrane biosynthesis protein TonB
MSATYFDPGYRPDVVRIRIIWVAVALSLLLHAVALWEWLPRMRPLTFENPVPGQSNSAIVAQLEQRPSPPPSSVATPPAAVTPPALTRPAPPVVTPPVRRRPTPRPPAPPPVLTAPTPAPVIVAPPAPPAPIAPPVTAAPAPAPAPAPMAGDLSAYVEARRRERGEATASTAPGSVPNAPPAETDTERRNRIVAANLGLSTTPTFGGDSKNSGGLFQVERLGYNDAQFLFNGWNSDIRRKSVQHIEVRKGDNSDIRYAVIRKMIAIIREHETGDFVWLSPRLGRELTLSARPSDNKELEAFMLKEFFAEWRPDVR